MSDSAIEIATVYSLRMLQKSNPAHQLLTLIARVT